MEWFMFLLVLTVVFLFFVNYANKNVKTVTVNDKKTFSSITLATLSDTDLAILIAKDARFIDRIKNMNTNLDVELISANYIRKLFAKYRINQLCQEVVNRGKSPDSPELFKIINHKYEALMKLNSEKVESEDQFASFSASASAVQEYMFLKAGVNFNDSWLFLNDERRTIKSYLNN